MHSMLRSIAAAATIAASTLASAQASPPPIGLWRGTASRDALWVQPNGQCSASGSVNISGSCIWQATATGGVLNMTYQWTIGPAHMYWSVRWLDRNTILLNNVERFVRAG